MLDEYIRYGQKNAIKTSTLQAITGLSSRDVRREVEKLRQTDVILNLQDGKGYFKPTEDEMHLVEQYIRQEEARMQAIAHNVGIARKFLLTINVD